MWSGNDINPKKCTWSPLTKPPKGHSVTFAQ